MERKQFGAALLDDEGTGRARIATLRVIDLDGDVVMPGALGRQTAMLLPSHDWSHVSLGKARVHEEGDSVLADFRLNLGIDAARELHEALKFDLAHPPPLQNWSWGFSIKPGGSRRGEFGGRQVRFLQPLPSGEPGVEVHEISTVVRGASIGSETLSMKRHAGIDPVPRFIYDLAAKFALVDAERKFCNSMATAERLRFEQIVHRAATVGYTETIPPAWMAAKAASVLPAIERALGASGTRVRFFKVALPGDVETFRGTERWGQADRESRTIWLSTEIPADRLARTIAHELRHLQQPGGLLPDEAERDAESWAPAIAASIERAI